MTFHSYSSSYPFNNTFSNKTNKHNKKTFGELYDKTLKKEKLIKSAGYNLITIWENDYHTSS